ncbi:MAG: DUF2069 domain-containing protein [Methylococcales bacterium]|nr:DUF2069 domain-containing protein [Methylococcales bacterium]
MHIKPTHYYTLALIGFFGLFTLLMVWNTLWYPSSKYPIALILLIAIAPLLLPLRGLLRANVRSCAWMAYLSIAYLMHGSVEAYVNVAERLPASLEVIFSTLLFVGSTFFIRFKKS